MLDTTLIKAKDNVKHAFKGLNTVPVSMYLKRQKLLHKKIYANTCKHTTGIIIVDTFLN